MINEVLTEILAAEKKAAEIRAEGDRKAAEIISNGEKTCAEIARKNAEEIKNVRAVTMKECSAEADAAYEKTLGESREAGKALREEKKGVTEKTAEEIYGRIINGDC